MTILKELLEQIKDNPLFEKLKIICDQIYEEEKPNLKYIGAEPKGARIFLSLEVPGKSNKEIGFITLELEDEEEFVIGYYTLQKQLINFENLSETEAGARLKKIWHIYDHRPEKILKEFAKKLKMLKGFLNEK